MQGTGTSRGMSIVSVIEFLGVHKINGTRPCPGYESCTKHTQCTNALYACMSNFERLTIQTSKTHEKNKQTNEAKASHNGCRAHTTVLRDALKPLLIWFTLIIIIIMIARSHFTD